MRPVRWDRPPVPAGPAQSARHAWQKGRPPWRRGWASLSSLLLDLCWLVALDGHAGPDDHSKSYPTHAVNLPMPRGRTLTCRPALLGLKCSLSAFRKHSMKTLAVTTLAALLIALGLGRPAAAAELNLWVMSTTEQQQNDMREILKPFLAAN